MSVRGGREFLAVPGPTTIPDEVLQAMQRPAVEIFSKPLIALTDSLLRDLGRLFATEGRCYIYIANGHGAWEAALSNVLSRGDKVLVLESGKFAVDWATPPCDSASRSRFSKATGTVPCARPKSSAACARTEPAQLRRFSRYRSTPALEL